MNKKIEGFGGIGMYTSSQVTQKKSPEKEVKSMKILVIESRPEERKKAVKAIKKAGHEARIFAEFSLNKSAFDKVDGVISMFNSTDHFDLSGMQVVKHIPLPLVICTKIPKTDPSYNAFKRYCSGCYPKSKWAWEENKNWDKAVEMLENQISQ